MPDSRSHRGAHPHDARDFGRAAVPTLVRATAELSWLLSRGYPASRSTVLVGDRHALRERQRKAVGRCAASRQSVELRRRSEIRGAAPGGGGEIWIDGYNVLLTVEAALGGGVLLLGADGALRDLAAMSSHFKRVQETPVALDLLGEHLGLLGFSRARWLLDRPISNSGRLRGLMLEQAERRGWDWRVELVANPDALLKQPEVPVATADSAILESGARWINLARRVVEASVENSWTVDLRTSEREEDPA